MRAPRRSPAVNTIVVLSIIAVMVIAGALIWNWWSVEAASAADGGPADPTPIWAFAVIGGPVLLFAALVFARMRSGKAARRDDPRGESDDPSRGL